MIPEHLKKRLAKDRPMTSITLRIPVDVVESLKEIAPLKGFSGYQPLLKAYIGEGLRRDEAEYDRGFKEARGAGKSDRGGGARSGVSPVARVGKWFVPTAFRVDLSTVTTAQSARVGRFFFSGLAGHGGRPQTAGWFSLLRLSVFRGFIGLSSPTHHELVPPMRAPL